jgi:hypothetical protein
MTALTILSQTQHGTLTRHARANAEYLALVSKGMELKLSILCHPSNAIGASARTGSDAVSTGGADASAGDASVEELAGALKKYHKALELRRRDLRIRKSGLEGQLAEYRKGSGKGEWDTLVRRYAVLMEEQGRIGEEIERLEKEHSSG